MTKKLALSFPPIHPPSRLRVFQTLGPIPIVYICIVGRSRASAPPRLGLGLPYPRPLFLLHLVTSTSMLVFVACANQQRDDELVGDETESYEKVIFGQRRPHSLAIDWTNKMVYVLEFKRTSDQRRDYRERGNRVHWLSMTCYSEVLKKWQERRGERVKDGK